MRCKQIQEEILGIMKEPVSRATDIIKHQVSKRCQALASFMESLMDEVACADLKLDLPQESELTASERDSVMLGEISPHHDYCDSKSSSETPPSYTQLNYDDNLMRFFSSCPKTLNARDELNLSDVCGELSSNQRCPGSGDTRSAGDCSSKSNTLMANVTRISQTTTTGSYAQHVSTALTEAILLRHNDDMEKGMVKKHKEHRCSVRNFNGEKSKMFVKESQSKEVHSDVQLGQGVKRSGSKSWEADILQNYKHQHLSDSGNNNGQRSPSATPTYVRNPAELWPPFAVSIPICSTQSLSPCEPQLAMASLPGHLSGVYLYPTTSIGHLPLGHLGAPPPSPEPFFIHGYIQAQTNTLLTAPQPLITYPSSIPLHSIASLTGVLPQSSSINNNTSTVYPTENPFKPKSRSVSQLIT